MKIPYISVGGHDDDDKVDDEAELHKSTCATLARSPVLLTSTQRLLILMNSLWSRFET